MTDITRKLELIANLKPKEMWPTELGPEFGETNNWCTALSAICAEALAEIQRLRFTDHHLYMIPYRVKLPTLRPPTDEPKPDPWGSAFAMNTENWK